MRAGNVVPCGSTKGGSHVPHVEGINGLSCNTLVDTLNHNQTMMCLCRIHTTPEDALIEANKQLMFCHKVRGIRMNLPHLIYKTMPDFPYPIRDDLSYEHLLKSLRCHLDVGHQNSVCHMLKMSRKVIHSVPCIRRNRVPIPLLTPYPIPC